MTDRGHRPRGRPSRKAEAAIGHRLVEATVVVLQRRGMAASMDEIAQEAGVSKQAIYRRYAGKTDLVRRVVDDGLSRLLAHQAQALAGIDDPLAALTAWTRLAFDNMASPQWLSATALFQRELRDVPELRADIERWEALSRAVPLALLEKLAQAGRMTVMPADEAAAILLDLIGAAQGRAERAMRHGDLRPEWSGQHFRSRWSAFARMLGA